MEITLSLPTSTAAPAAVAPVVPRAITTKVQAIEAADKGATLPDNKPFVAQVVTARLSGSEYPQNPSEIAPPERTLRPYDVPMLPYESSDAAQQAEGAETADTADSTAIAAVEQDQTIGQTPALPLA